jgi:hypothetical protein
MPELKSKRKGLVCFECDVQADHAHHVVPKSLGGTKTVNLCAPCHSKVHSPHLLKTSALTKKAMDERKALGMYCGGNVPYGKKLKDAFLIDHVGEQKIINKIVQLSEKHSQKYIVNLLNEKGFLKRGKLWSKYSIWRILRNARRD